MMRQALAYARVPEDCRTTLPTKEARESIRKRGSLASFADMDESAYRPHHQQFLLPFSKTQSSTLKGTSHTRGNK
eukprot:c13206_g1_i1 orf=594-818(+)